MHDRMGVWEPVSVRFFARDFTGARRAALPRVPEGADEGECMRARQRCERMCVMGVRVEVGLWVV